MGDGRGGDVANIAILLTWCGLNTLSRSGPTGQFFACAAGCLAFLVGIVVLIVYLANTDFSTDDNDGGSNMSSVSHHAPRDTSMEAFWTNFILIAAIFLVASMPVIYYVPTYMRGGSQRKPSAQTYTGAPQGAVRPLLALAEIPASGLAVERV